MFLTTATWNSRRRNRAPDAQHDLLDTMMKVLTTTKFLRHPLNGSMTCACTPNATRPKMHVLLPPHAAPVYPSQSLTCDYLFPFFGVAWVVTVNHAAEQNHVVPRHQVVSMAIVYAFQ